MKGNSQESGSRLGSVVRHVMAAVSLAVALYLAFAQLFSTPEEERLKRENAQYAREYASLREREQLIGDVTKGLLEKDGAIYRELFETEAPSLNPTTAADLIPDSDSLSESFYLSYSASKSESLRMMASSVEDNFREIYRLMESRRDSLPPLSLPIRGMSYVQTGASTGTRHNLLYKVDVQHSGMDLEIGRAHV